MLNLPGRKEGRTCLSFFCVYSDFGIVPPEKRDDVLHRLLKCSSLWWGWTIRQTSGNGVRLWLRGLLSLPDPHRCRCSQPKRGVSVSYSATRSQIILMIWNQEGEHRNGFVDLPFSPFSVLCFTMWLSQRHSKCLIKILNLAGMFVLHLYIGSFREIPSHNFFSTENSQWLALFHPLFWYYTRCTRARLL